MSTEEQNTKRSPWILLRKQKPARTGWNPKKTEDYANRKGKEATTRSESVEDELAADYATQANFDTEQTAASATVSRSVLNSLGG